MGITNVIALVSTASEKYLVSSTLVLLSLKTSTKMNKKTRGIAAGNLVCYT